MAESSSRIAWIDFAKGIVMLTVIFGHAAVYNHEKIFVDALIAVYEFHMPFFFVTAGFLLNLSKWGGAENFRPFAAKLFKRLFVPYYVAELLWYPIWFVVCHKASRLGYVWLWDEIEPSEAFTAIFIGNGNDTGLILGQLWFLPALLAAEIIFVKLHDRLNKIGAEIFTLSVVACSSVGFIFNGLRGLPMGLDIAFAAQIFLLAGVLIRRHRVLEKIDPKICGGLTLILIVAFLFNERIDMNFRFYGNELLFYAGGVAGTLLVMKLSALMTGGKIFSLISACGRQSMMILVLHPIMANIFYEIPVRAADFPTEKIFTEPTIILGATVFCTLVPLWIAERFGKLPVLKIFCA